MRRTEISFLVSEAFDPAAAERLCANLRGLPTKSLVVLDFSQAREVSIPALGALAKALAAPDAPPTTVRGLPRHLQRLLGDLSSRAPGRPHVWR